MAQDCSDGWVSYTVNEEREEPPTEPISHHEMISSPWIQTEETCMDLITIHAPYSVQFRQEVERLVVLPAYWHILEERTISHGAGMCSHFTASQLELWGIHCSQAVCFQGC